MDFAAQVSHESVVASEAVQRTSWRMLSGAASPALVDALSIKQKDVGSTFFHSALKVPGAQFNKVFSFGIDGDFSPEMIETASDWLRTNCVPQSLLMAPEVAWQDELDRRLLRHGLRRFPLDIEIFHMDAADVPDLTGPAHIEVRPVSSENAGVFGQVLSEGLEAPSASDWLAAFAVGQPGLTAYLAYDGSTAIGAAALLVDGEWGWLFIAAVRPAYRRRGAQWALLARRLDDGRKAGVRMFNIGALRPPPGRVEGFSSYRNIQRAGFRSAYKRPNYVAVP